MMLAQLDLFASGESCRRARSLSEARELVASFNADRDTVIRRIERRMYREGIQVGDEDAATRKQWNERVREINRQASDKEYRDRIDRGEIRNPLDLDETNMFNADGDWRDYDPDGSASAATKRRAVRIASDAVLRREDAGRHFDWMMQENTPEAAAWRDREAIALEVAAALSEWDVPFGDDPPAGVFGYVDDVIGDVHVPMRALRVGKAKPTVPLESFRYQGASRVFDDDMRRRAPAQSTNSPSVGGMMIRSDIMATAKACACVECQKAIPAGEIIELVTEPCEAGPFCSWKCRTAGVDRAMRRPTALLEAVHGCEECGSVTPRLLLDHGRKLCTACWTLSVD